MIATKETRRPYISSKLWEREKPIVANFALSSAKTFSGVISTIHI